MDGSVLWPGTNVFDLSRGAPDANPYGTLSDLEFYRRDGKFELQLRWPGHPTWTQPQHWTQTNNPVRDAAGAVPTGYASVSTPYLNNGWLGGLQRSQGEWSVLDGTLNPNINWYYAVGSRYCWGGVPTCQPAPDGGAQISELWVR